ncbi:unknown protein [Seminavis robusta]|uniref:Uncharacterized protein n=1 Tax=Seminavis robusta TaxID=568900 RepID=A0A9N8DG82_9STRA|nr:unknown protein [Seminavis robusta]|eukprot:Sro136_g063940.1 n/a (500) ;mRNA; f:7534-9033
MPMSHNSTAEDTAAMELYYQEHMHYEPQYIIPLIFVNMLSCSLSILGSTSIMSMAWRANKSKPQIMQRLLFGLSLADLVTTLAFLFMPFLAPQEEGLAWAVGNRASTTAVGFFFLAALMCANMMNMYLSIYFLLVVRRNWREQHFTQRGYETTAFAVAVLIPLLDFVPGAIFGMTNTNEVINNFVSYNASPWDCMMDEESCERPIKGNPQVWSYVGAAPFTMFSIICFACTFMVYWTARTTFRKSKSYDFTTSTTTNATTAGNNDPTNTRCRLAGSSMVQGLRGDELTETGTTQRERSPSTISTIIQSVRRSTSRHNKTSGDRKANEVATQAILYCLVYTNTLIWPFTGGMLKTRPSAGDDRSGAQVIYEWHQDPAIYVLHIVFWMFFPLQGFLNWFVYTRIKVKEWRRADPDCSTFHIYRLILMGIPIPVSSRDNVNRANELPNPDRYRRAKAVRQKESEEEKTEEELPTLHESGTTTGLDALQWQDDVDLEVADLEI